MWNCKWLLIDSYFFNENVNRENFMELLKDHLSQLFEDVDLHT